MKYLLFMLILFIVSCETDLQFYNQSNLYSNEFLYFKEEKTNLCFAYTYAVNSTIGGLMSNVPCESVEKFLQKRPW